MFRITGLLVLIVISCLVISVGTQFRQYHTKYSTHNGDHTCFYRYANEFNGNARHLVPYCVRTSRINQTESQLPCYGNNATFLELKQNNVTDKQLMEWFAPIDLISDYQNFLFGGSVEAELFCNCSRADRSFGTRCQYQLAANTSSFHELVDLMFVGKIFTSDIRNLTEEYDVTCYILFNCTTYTGFCLDWRQICDGKRDCVNGQDEEQCMGKELSECDEKTEYRCLSGHCIPRVFSFDLTFDCPDWDDEQSHLSNEPEMQCSQSAFAHCEERGCTMSRYSCGDGQCIHDKFDIGITFMCRNQRNTLLIKRVYRFRKGLSEACWQHMVCMLGLSCLYELPTVSDSFCSGHYDSYKQTASFCYELSIDSTSCPVTGEGFFPTMSMVFPYVQVLFDWQQLAPKELESEYYFSNEAFCYNVSACGINTWALFNSSSGMNKYECHNLRILLGINYKSSWYYSATGYASMLLTTLQSLFADCSSSTSHPKLHRCRGGAHISRHRLMDGRVDCYLDKGDEHEVDNVCKYNLTNRFECVSISNEWNQGNITCKPRRLLKDNYNDCWNLIDELFPGQCTYEYDCQFYRDHDISKSFPLVYEEFCNGVDLFRGRGDNVSEDEMDCDAWPCQARAHRCDGVWNRPNGCDEIDCPDLLTTYLSRVVANCSHDEHYCLRFNQSTLSCLPVERAADGRIDCLFGMDERTAPELQLWRLHADTSEKIIYGRCQNSTTTIIFLDLCDRKPQCPLHDDELMCPWHSKSNCSYTQFTCKNGTCIPHYKKCNNEIDCWPEAEDEWACYLRKAIYFGQYQSFNLTDFATESHEEQIESSTLTMVKNTHAKSSPLLITYSYFVLHCHRGIILRSKDGNDACLCPPSYYGTRCEFQSERLSMTFRSEMPPIFDETTIYHLIFLLLDDNRKSLSMEVILHMPSRQSRLKHLIYLIYPRHHNQSLNRDLSVHIEAHKATTTKVGSLSLAWFYRVQFPFLPVNALSFKLDLEPLPLNATLCHRLGCLHGRCTSYVNIRDKHFCSCQQGWTGRRCDQLRTKDPCAQLKCDTTCSKCVVHDNHAVCLCTLGRIGHNCRVPYDVCNGVRCQNGGQCVSLNENTLQRTCLCRGGYFGDVCQFRTASLTILIPRIADFIPVMVVHFLHTLPGLLGVLSHRNTFFLKNVHPPTSVTIQDRQQQFLPSIIMIQTFVDLSNNYGSYYLLSVLDHNRSSLTKALAHENRCVHVTERLNTTIMNFRWSKRAKLYHHYFRDVRCFFDEVYMCLVDRDQQIDCLLFDHKVAHCTDRNYCENGGRCLQSKQGGQIQFACVCPECHYGLFCQLTMTQYSLTLDSMLGQEIITDAPLHQQKIFIKIILALVVLIFVVGMASNICSTLTLYDENIQSCGCGCYLFIFSVASQISLVLFSYRFFYLLISQITIISNRQFLNISCLLLDFLLQVSISFCDWLSACVACERTVSVIKGINFNRKSSVRMVKFVSSTLLICLILTSIHQVFGRELIPDPRSDDRLWCVVKFSKGWLATYNTVMNMFNSIVPFVINFISAILLLITFSRSKQKTAKMKYTIVLQRQIIEHKDLFISPIIMVSCKLPMLIVVLVIKCIKSKWELYLSTACYLLALVPLLATFGVFILPAPSYMKVFSTKRIRLLKRR